MKYINQLGYPNIPYPTTLERDAPLRTPYPQRCTGGLRIVLRLHGG
jgi:hypothetical protein